MECCTRKPVKTSRCPLSIMTGMCKMISRVGYRRTFIKPSSRFNFWAAKSKRAACASHGLISCSREMVFSAIGGLRWCGQTVKCLAGAGRYIPEGAGKRSKDIQGPGGEGSYGVRNVNRPRESDTTNAKQLC